MAIETYTREGAVAPGYVNGGDPATGAKVMVGGFSAEAVAGAGAVVLAILALCGVLPRILTAIGVIALGAAFLCQGAAVAYNSFKASVTPVGTGTNAETIAGVAAIVLGILALVGIAPLSLVAISAIVFGGGLLFGTRAGYAVTTQTGSAGQLAVPTGASGSQTLIGVGAATLGILALVGIIPAVLEQVAVLCVGAGALLGGGAITGRMVAMLSR